MTNDVRSPGGWLSLYGVRLAKGIAIGTVTLAAFLNLYGPLNFKSTPGTSTGATLTVDGLPRWKTFPVTCSASGGSTNTAMCATRSPLTTSGTLLGADLECGNVAMALIGDVSIKKSKLAATGSALTNLNGVTLGTGAKISVRFAQGVSWNPTDVLTFTTLLTPTGTLSATRYDCQMWPVMLDAYGS